MGRKKKKRKKNLAVNPAPKMKPDNIDNTLPDQAEDQNMGAPQDAFEIPQREVQTEHTDMAQDRAGIEPAGMGREKSSGAGREEPVGVEQEKAEAQSSEAADPKGDKAGDVSWKKWLKISVCAAALVLFGFYLGGIVYFHGRFLANTTVNGVDTSCLTVSEAEERIRSRVEDYEIVLKERGGEKETITAQDIDYRYLPNGEIQRLCSSQCYALWFVRYFRPAALEFDAAVGFDEELLERKADVLKCFDKSVEEAPSDAKIVFRSTKFEIQKEKQGRKVKKSRFLDLLAEAITKRRDTLDLEKEGCYEVPKVTSQDAALNRQLTEMNHYADIEITYCFGDKKEILNGRVVKDWLICDEKGKVLVKDGAISDYIAYLAEKYDTYDKPRRFKTSDGTYVTVEGGSYGWKLDQGAEAADLTELMEQEPHMERTPLFAQTAGSWENGDMGDTYVEVDLTKQHLWMYIDGELIVESDFVSGKMTGDRRTPPGTYTLYYKKSPAVLKSNKPGDSYESPVTFWMPFNGGIGFHDSSWRGSYGGGIFWNNGSHGCINLPYSAAKTIYQNIEKGFPVICFYRNGEYE